MDVILKVCEIVLGKILFGKRIENYDVWFRRICFNVIRNFVKKIRFGKLIEFKLKNKSDLIYLREDLIYVIEFNLKLLEKVWEKLNEEEKVILLLREVEEYLWKEVVKRIVDFEELIIKDLDDEKKLVDRV